MNVIASPLRVVLVDDHNIVREGIRLLLGTHHDMVVVGEAATSEEALELLDEAAPDVMILDVSLGDEDALPLIGLFLQRRPGLKILVLTMHRDPETVRQALASGSAGYLVKGAYSSELVVAIRAVAHGERYLHSSITTSVVDDFLQGSAASSDITTREREILSLIASGQSAPGVGRALGISTHTVRRHLANVRVKLRLHGRGALIRYAVVHDMVRTQDIRATGG
jgi:DNA-binding NarL/FixJ family response regulator